MGSFEEDVRPALERMIEGKRTFLRREMRDKLAQYFTYKMLVLDWMGGDPILPPEWGREFYQTKQIPRGVHIWLFRCFEWADIETYGCGLAEIDDPRSETDLFPNSKSFAVGIGELFVFAVLSSEIELDTEFNPLVSKQLWPFVPQLLTWPPHNVISRDQAAFVSGTLSRIGESPSVIDERG